MINIQEVHEVKYKINLNAEKLAPAVYFEMLRVFDILSKIDSKEDIKKSLSDYYTFINNDIITIPFDDSEYILFSEKNQKDYVNNIIMGFAGHVINQLIEKTVPVNDPDIYRHCIFDADNWVYTVQRKIVKLFENKPYDDIYQKTIEVFKKHNYGYSDALKMSKILGVDIKQCAYL